MTKDEYIMRMAREAGLVGGPVYAKGLEAFANLVAAAENEACAKLCELLPPEWPDQNGIAQAEKATMMDCAAAIRIRGQAWLKTQP
jgi:hypothetical protein